MADAFDASASENDSTPPPRARPLSKLKPSPFMRADKTGVADKDARFIAMEAELAATRAELATLKANNDALTEGRRETEEENERLNKRVIEMDNQLEALNLGNKELRTRAGIARKRLRNIFVNHYTQWVETEPAKDAWKTAVFPTDEIGTYFYDALDEKLSLIESTIAFWTDAQKLLPPDSNFKTPEDLYRCILARLPRWTTDNESMLREQLDDFFAHMGPFLHRHKTETKKATTKVAAIVSKLVHSPVSIMALSQEMHALKNAYEKHVRGSARHDQAVIETIRSLARVCISPTFDLGFMYTGVDEIGTTTDDIKTMSRTASNRVPFNKDQDIDQWIKRSATETIVQSMRNPAFVHDVNVTPVLGEEECENTFKETQVRQGVWEFAPVLHGKTQFMRFDPPTGKVMITLPKGHIPMENGKYTFILHAPSATNQLTPKRKYQNESARPNPSQDETDLSLNE